MNSCPEKSLLSANRTEDLSDSHIWLLLMLMVLQISPGSYGKGSELRHSVKSIFLYSFCWTAQWPYIQLPTDFMYTHCAAHPPQEAKSFGSTPSSTAASLCESDFSSPASAGVGQRSPGSELCHQEWAEEKSCITILQRTEAFWLQSPLTLEEEHAAI